jgi:hypothetical protein
MNGRKQNILDESVRELAKTPSARWIKTKRPKPL